MVVSCNFNLKLFIYIRISIFGSTLELEPLAFFKAKFDSIFQLYKPSFMSENFLHVSDFSLSRYNIVMSTADKCLYIKLWKEKHLTIGFICI